MKLQEIKKINAENSWQRIAGRNQDQINITTSGNGERNRINKSSYFAAENLFVVVELSKKVTKTELIVENVTHIPKLLGTSEGINIFLYIQAAIQNN